MPISLWIHSVTVTLTQEKTKTQLVNRELYLPTIYQVNTFINADIKHLISVHLFEEKIAFIKVNLQNNPTYIVQSQACSHLV